MAPIIEQILNLFYIPLGNLIYSSVLAICAFTAWLACIYARGEIETTAGKRMQLGLLFLFLAQVLLFAASWVAWLGIINQHSYLPPLDRTLAGFSLVLVIWLWAIAEPNKFWDAAVALVEIFIVLFGITGMVVWLREGVQLNFNGSALGAYAYYASFGLLIIGIIVLLGRHPRYWGYGFLMLLVMLGGYITQIMIVQAAADYTWFVHLGEMVAFFFLLLLPKRLVGLGRLQVVKPPDVTSGLPTPRLDGKIIQAIADIVSELSPQKYYQELIRLVAQVMNAEFCLLMIPPKTGEQIIVPLGYNATQGTLIEGFTADGRYMPSLLEAVKNGNSLRLSGSTSSEVRTLAEQLKMQHISHLLAAPFHPRGTAALMAIVLLSKPPMPVWSGADASQLKDVTDTLLANVGRASGSGRSADQADVAEKLQIAEARVDQVRLEYAQLKAKYDSILPQAENEKVLEADITRLENRNRELESLLARGRPSMEEVEQLRQELRAALTDLARIPSALSKSDQKMLETQLSAVKSLDKMQPTALITSISQELRQPLSSIVGYTDLLLGESVGLLGAVQRKFLERVKASTERLGILLDELMEVVSIDGGKVDKTPSSVELEPVIREAITNITSQLDEKNINIKIDLRESLGSIQANKDALLQILDNLLENACLITPADGTIKLSATIEQKDGEQNFILISVADQGGGIDRADISRVFLRRYKMENPLIKGVGDSGVGLSIVKSLVELLKGRVWVDSDPDGSTFSVLLPLTEGQIRPINSNTSKS
jgi:signal transduction histidine kinase